MNKPTLLPDPILAADERTLIRRAAEVEWMASDVRNAKMRIHYLELAKTYRRLAKMRRRVDLRLVEPSRPSAH